MSMLTVCIHGVYVFFFVGLLGVNQHNFLPDSERSHDFDSFVVAGLGWSWQCLFSP